MQHETHIKEIDEVNRKIWNLRGVPDFAGDPIQRVTDALEKARRIAYSFGEIMAYYIVGSVYKDLKKYTEAKCYYKAESLPDSNR